MSQVKKPLLKAILTDSQLWVPVIVLVLGIVLLVWLG
jgi:hypothetical protein